MKDNINFKTKYGKVIVEVNGIGSKKGRKDVSLLKKAGDFIEKSLRETLSNTLKGVIDSTHGFMEEMDERRPNEMEIKYGVKFTLEGDAVIVSGSSDANIEITMKWKA